MIDTARNVPLLSRSGIGLALVIGTVVSYAQTPKGDPLLLFSRGHVLVLFAMIAVCASACSKLSGARSTGRMKGLIFRVMSRGCLMGFSIPRAAKSNLAAFQRKMQFRAGYLTVHPLFVLYWPCG